MPPDRSNTNTSRPLKPTLATTRTAKTPVTPRLAPSAAPASVSQPSRTVRSNASNTPRANTAGHHLDDATPVKAFLNNVTPRSSSRKSRVGVGSTQSTPSGTPSGTPISTRPSSTVDFPQKEQGHGYSGLGINGLNSAQNANRPRSVVAGASYNAAPTPRPPISNVYNHTPAEASGARGASPMFFHANEARSQEHIPPPKKAAVFFYANGEQDGNPQVSEAPSPPLSSVGKSQAESKFFHADSISEARASPPILTPPPVSAPFEPWSNSTPAQGASSLQPPSPSKEYHHLSYRKGASQIIRPNLHSRPSALSVLSGTQTPDIQSDRSRRRSSAASSAVRLGHGKSASLSSIDSVTSLKKVSSNDLPSIVPSPLHNENRVISNGSLAESVASAPPPTTETLSGLPSPNPQSPTKPNGGQSALERMNELAANARRERKVLDLEISNSSLLAINRQLEREVRKQKAELRRFRRMSRAGRFSTDTTTTALEGFSAIGVSDLAELTDMEEEDDEPEDDDHLSSSESSFDESAMSPNALAERDAAHRLRDEKRLQLDLSKHRELLVDSQKMNQSLKRCLNWTEELIKDAQKALTYQVRVSDIKLGGRVLEQTEGEPDESKALLSPWTPPHRATDPLDRASLAGSERTDRDSGIDVDGLKPITTELHPDISPLGSPIGETPSRPPRSVGGLQDIY